MIGGLYCIDDNSLAPDRDHVALARDFLAGGAKVIQLRDKTGSRLQAAQEIMKLKERFAFTFIVNDYVDVAMAVGADGLHVGADDMSIAAARRLLGPKKIIGYSSHSLEEAIRAEAQGADYVAFGAIFPTATKGPHHPIQGLKKLHELTRRIKIPVVAIGGIRRDNVRQVLEAGAKGFAMIAALTQAANIPEEVRWFANLSY